MSGEVPPKPGKCLTTATTWAAIKPVAKATTSVASLAGDPPKERYPSGSDSPGKTARPSTSATGARSVLSPALAMADPTVTPVARI